MVWPAAESVAASAVDVVVTIRGEDERRCQWRGRWCLRPEGARGARELGRQRSSSAADDRSGGRGHDAVAAAGVQAARDV